MISTDHVSYGGKLLAIFPFGVGLLMAPWFFTEGSTFGYMAFAMLLISGGCCLASSSAVQIDPEKKIILSSGNLLWFKWSKSRPLSDYREISVIEVVEKTERHRDPIVYAVALVHKYEKNNQLYGTGCLNFTVRGFKQDKDSANKFAEFLSNSIELPASISVDA